MGCSFVFQRALTCPPAYPHAVLAYELQLGWEVIRHEAQSSADGYAVSVFRFEIEGRTPLPPERRRFCGSSS
jgi:hypothetical protein